MPSPLLNAGAQLDGVGENKYAPLHVNRWWTGLWTNRSLLRDAASTYLIEKFYAGARFESMVDGQNIEISPRLTPTRRPGNSQYNSQIFPAIKDFYAFRNFNTRTFAESIQVIADTASVVYDATGPSTKTVILNKAAGAGQTSFQSIGNTLYMADGVDLKKFIAKDRWQANTKYNIGDVVVDSNGNLQKAVAWFFETTSSVQVAANQVTFTVPNIFNAADFQNFVGFQIIAIGLVGANFLNNQTLTISSVTGTTLVTAPYFHPNYGPAADGGSLWATPEFSVPLPFTTGISGNTETSWASTVGTYTADFEVLWVCVGPPVIDWQPIGPVNAPVVSNVPNTNLGTPWVANTFYNPSLLIIDSNNNLQLLTTAGQTAGSVPIWSAVVAATTTDGTAVWTCKGTSVRQTSHAYVIGDYIQVTFTIIVIRHFRDPETHQVEDEEVVLGPYTNSFKCTTAGTSSATATGNLKWSNGKGSKLQDGTVVWTNQGNSITRTVAATSATNIGNSLLASLDQQIVDANGNFQNLSGAGKSGTVAPTWSTAIGTGTTDNQAVWVNGGPATAANTLPWVYGFGFKNSITESTSESSPKSIAIILAVTSYISISGDGDPNWATDGIDTIQIYRSTLNHTDLFLLDEIPAPANGGPWSYLDNTPDPPDPNSILDEFISADVNGINAPPPAGMVGLSYYLSRMWGIVGEFAYYSSSPQQSVGVNTDNWPGNNFFQFPSTVTKLFPSPTGMIFFTNQGLYLSAGTDGNGNPSQPIPFLDTIGLLSPNCFTVNGSNPMIFTADRQLINLDPGSGVSRIGFPIEDQLQTFDPTGSYVTWHTAGSDQAAYISNGTGMWFRLNLTPAPETGSYTWSPRAQLVGGGSCVKSIETSPGVRDLLIGPNASFFTGSSRHILKRDFGTRLDDGVAYPADFTVGCIVFAQPGQAAEIAFITTEELRAGSQVTPAILADELFGTFEAMSNPVNDPPWATPSNSVYSSRWYFDSVRTPGWMRYLQIKFSWPAEDAANELYTYSPVAALHSDPGN